MKNFLNYSKFVFDRSTGAETHPRTPETPGQQVDRSLTTLQRKQQAELKEKEEAAKKLRDNKEKLHKAWMETTPAKAKDAPDDNPAYAALKNIPGYDGKEAFALLSVISRNSKLGGTSKADELLRSSYSGGRFSLDKLRSFFTRDFGYGTLGFYFGTKKETKIIKTPWYKKNKKKTITKKGWWTIDADDKNNDEFSGEQSFLKAIHHIRKELSVPEAAGAKAGYNDSSLGAAEEKLLAADLEKIDKETRNASNEVFGKDIMDWLNANAKNGWTVLNAEIIGKFTYLFGEGCGKYQYRIFKDRVYCLRIPGAAIPGDKKEAGYFEIKNGKLEPKWNDLKTEDLKKLLADQMSPVEIEREMAAYKMESGTPLAAEDKLNASKGLVSTITGLPHVEYDNLESGYLQKVKEQLEKKLKEKGVPADKIHDIAEARKDQLRRVILDKINANEALKKAVNEDGKVKLDIRVNEKDEVTVGFADTAKKSHFEKTLREKADKDKIQQEINEKKAAFEKKIKKIFGPLSPLIMKILKLDEGLKDMASGVNSKAAKTLGIIGGFLGINVAAKKFGSRKINQKEFDGLIAEGKNEHDLKKRIVLTEDITLKGKKIVIPKGKGIVPGGKLKARILKENNQQEEVELNKNAKGGKKRFSLGFLGGGSEEQHKDDEITIEAGTVVPKQTVIPSGAKILKV